MNNRGEPRAVVDWEIVEAAFFLGFRVSVGTGPTNEPEHGRGLPLGSEASEIFARWSRPGVHDVARGEMGAERIGHALARLLVVDVQRIAIGWSDLRRPGRTG